MPAIACPQAHPSAMIGMTFVSLRPFEVGSFYNEKWLPSQDFKRYLVFLNSILVETNELKVQKFYFLLGHICQILLFTNTCTSTLLQISGDVKPVPMVSHGTGRLWASWVLSSESAEVQG